MSYWKTLAHPSEYPVQIIRKNRLKKLRDNTHGFFKEFKNYDIQDISDEKIQEFLVTNKLTMTSLLADYGEDYYQKKN